MRLRCSAIIGLALVSAPTALPAQPAQRAVLVTGASSGIGRKVTELLASRGFFVYATARKPEDLAALDRIPNVKSIRLDVTAPAEIAAAVEAVRQGGRGLYGLVNNAGGAIVGPLIEHEETEMAWQFDVNVYGPWRLVKAFAPMLIESKGRITNISSVSGVLSGPMLGAYSMTKHALEAFTDALGAEMARFGVVVNAVEPGNYRSEAGRAALSRLGDVEARAARSRYPNEIRALGRNISGYDQYAEPIDVAEAVYHALHAPTPKARYLVTTAGRGMERVAEKSLEELVQLNQGHRFTIGRDSLVTLLDAALKRVAP
ncbi:MAG: SDR family NAD(P)-dependent oxidoreductase [Gemmatimonadetes bacterium]|nr:SDR family NAD(P)-dependent oxidoreductase [Gemmatimonadota bacterium]